MAEAAPAGAEAPEAVPPAEASAAGCNGNGAAPAEESSGGASQLMDEVTRCKVILENKDSPREELLAALMALRKMGSLPTKVLSETLIGKAVNTHAKSAADDSVRQKAKDLVEDWKQMHRKRKSGGGADGQPALKRGLSSSMSLDLGASQDSQPQTSQEGGQAGVPRTDSLLSLGEDSIDAAGPAKEGEIQPHRLKVRQKLVEALGKVEEIEAKDGKTAEEESMVDPVKLASEIDEALHGTFPTKEPYLAQARSIIYNLKDKKNHTFRFKLLVGFYKAKDVPKLTAEDMASDEKNAERAKQRKYAMEEIQTDWALKNGQQRITGMFTCGKCKGTKTTYFQMQTRSSDEPMTTFVTCLTCNNRWKFC
mmetsp:Transcript_8230/g.20843  ORF Transcript_8230/g.20843 Transcript_8230/m.20843 type:complete len:366 (+) Transcript_8230:37-1134(+)